MAVGFIGLGTMSLPMVQWLVKNSVGMFGWDINADVMRTFDKSTQSESKSALQFSKTLSVYRVIKYF